ncbi:MAG TPA: hypothetical protein VLH15_07890 [Dehalococcoidales bacterium]|nr:hypothetical protein [Dehalococcoidales bacterium]
MDIKLKIYPLNLHLVNGSTGCPDVVVENASTVPAVTEIKTSTPAATENQSTQSTLRLIMFLAAGFVVLNIILWVVVWRVLRKFKKL